MSKVQMLRALVQQRLTAAVEEIFGLFERTIAEYEEELCRSKEENERQQKLLDAVFNPQLRLHTTDVQQLSVVKEEVPPEQQECSSSLDQDPEPPHIKEEQEELWSSQEGEQLQGLEEADITKFTFTPVPVKSEDDEEKPQSSQVKQTQTEPMKTEADGEDYGGPEPARNSAPDAHVTPETEDKTGDSSETDVSDDWKETREPQSGLKSRKDDEVPVSDSRCSADEKIFICSECGKRFGTMTHLKEHMRTHTGEKPFTCSECGKRFGRKTHLKRHTRSHTGEKPFSCSECGNRFDREPNLKRHMATHTGEKPFSCLVCAKQFTNRANMTHHMSVHTGEKQFSCSVCNKRFAWRLQVKRHKCVGCQSSQLHQSQTEENREVEPQASSSTEPMKTQADGEDCGGPEPDRNSHPDTHVTPETEDSDDWKETREPQSGLNSLKDDDVPVSDSRCSAGEKTFICSECGNIFGTKAQMKTHMRFHTGKKLFSCSVCDKTFFRRADLKRHMITHTGEKPFSCSVCGKRFIQKILLTQHMTRHTGEKQFSCSVCNKRFTWCSQVKRHKCVGRQSSQLHQTQTEENREVEPPASSQQLS